MTAQEALDHLCRGFNVEAETPDEAARLIFARYQDLQAVLNASMAVSYSLQAKMGEQLAQLSEQKKGE